MTLYHQTQDYVLRLEPCVSNCCQMARKVGELHTSTKSSSSTTAKTASAIVLSQLRQETTGTGQYVADTQPLLLETTKCTSLSRSLQAVRTLTIPLATEPTQRHPWGGRISQALYNAEKTVAYGIGTRTATAGLLPP